MLREGDVAFDDARAHPRARLVGLLGVLGELQRGAAVSDGEVSAAEWAVLALLQFVLQRAFVHAVDEVERARPELDALVGTTRIVVAIVVGPRARSGGGGDDGEQNGALTRFGFAWHCAFPLISEGVQPAVGAGVNHPDDCGDGVYAARMTSV